MSSGVGTVSELYHYPIRGLSAQRLATAQVGPDTGFPHDRVWALAGFDSAAKNNPNQPLASHNYHGPTRSPRLLGVRSHLDPVTHHLEVYVREHRVFSGNLQDEGARAEAERLLARVLDLPPEKRPRLIRRTSDAFTLAYADSVDASMHRAVHVLNLASVRELSARINTEIDPLRFRANIHLDLDEPWIEREWLDQRFTCGDAVFTVKMHTGRCAATEVNPTDATPDIPVPRLLQQHYGHSDMGFYATIASHGTLIPGSPVALHAEDPA